MGCASCGGQVGSIDAPRGVERVLTAAEVESRMPRRPERRPYRELEGSPRGGPIETQEKE